nr:MAG TPA: hypothetical protein [Caudoviricetes sp.]
MGKTSTWNIHYDDPNDIAKGRLQAQKLAESADAAVSSCKQQVFQDYTGKISQAENQANDYTDRQVQAAKVERNTQIDLVNKNIESNKKDIEQKLSTATTEAIRREQNVKSELRVEFEDRVPVNMGPDETWYTYVDAATLPKWPLDTAPNNSIIFLYAVNTGTAWNVPVEAGQFYIFNKDKTGKTHYAQISNPYSLTRLVPLANDITAFFTAESSSTKKIHTRLAEAESTIAQLKSEIEALKKKQQ